MFNARKKINTLTALVIELQERVGDIEAMVDQVPLLIDHQDLEQRVSELERSEEIAFADRFDIGGEG